MTKQQLQQELKEKVKEGIKPSHLKKLKRSKSADDIPASSTQSVPLKKSQSQLEIPLQPSLKEQVIQLQDQVKFHSETAANYLQSLQTSQAKVNELEEKLNDNSPNALLSEQLKEKQKEVENLRKKLEEKNQELKTLKTEQSTLLDTNLTLKHQSLKDWFTQYQKTKDLESELKENVDYASDELINQDRIINDLRNQTTQLKQQNQSLQKDLNLATKLAELRSNTLAFDKDNELRKGNWPDNSSNWDYLKLGLYSLLALWLVLKLLNPSPKIVINQND